MALSARVCENFPSEAGQTNSYGNLHIRIFKRAIFPFLFLLDEFLGILLGVY